MESKEAQDLRLKEMQFDFEREKSLDESLSVLQRSILATTHYWCIRYGFYGFYKTKVYKDYESVHTKKEIDEAIDNLLKRDYLRKDTKLITYNGRYSTQVKLYVEEYF